MPTRRQMLADAAKNNMITPQEIEELLILEDWTQGDLARLLHVGDATVSRYVNGENEPPIGTQMILRQWLDKARKKHKARCKALRSA